MLPEHAGGAFENVTKGSRLIGEVLADPRVPVQSRGGGWGVWAQQVAWGTSKSIGSTSSLRHRTAGARPPASTQFGGAGGLGVPLAYSPARTARTTTS